jgi:hypothetical protein
VIFHEASIALKVAVAVAALFPAGATYCILALRHRRLTFGAALAITISYVFSFIAISILFSNFDAWLQGHVSWTRMLKSSLEITAIAFPALLLTAISGLMVMIVWRSEMARYVFAGISVLAQISYLVNVTLFMFGVDVFHF